MSRNISWLEVYKKNGEWKIANGKTNKVLRTARTKRKAKKYARDKVNYPNTRDGYIWLGAQVYDSNGNRETRIVGTTSVKRWLKLKSRRH